ncbi:UNKNOWN [Stylonychia lemnae]|uniref:Uncharacterized protein n=1 Tax=Stylonychia lemnae TaxID=5949 RepID=A0A078AL93_STYLE|nr:UNKNOWN [Stylonychia lemnae]|eukprot:CDW82182.1 UNKNOWN [Stylonychia lemnae]
MGNCSQCLRDGSHHNSKNKSSVHSTHLSTHNDEQQQTPRYTKVTIDQVFEDGGEELGYLGQVDNDQMMTFTVHFYNIRLLSFNVRDEMFLMCDIDEDTRQRLKDNMKKNKEIESVQKDHQSFKQSPSWPALVTEIVESNGIRWKTQPFVLDKEGNQQTTTSNLNANTKIFGRNASLWYIPQQYFLALALGPKHCDFEMRNYKSKRSLGRLAFDVSIKQLQNMELSLQELRCKLNYKEEKPIFGYFKFITNHGAPKVSEPTYSQIGRYKKDKNRTTFRWHIDDDPTSIPKTSQTVSLESLKYATLLIGVKVDRFYSEAIHDLVIQKLSLAKKLRGQVHQESESSEAHTHNNEAEIQIYVREQQNSEQEQTDFFKSNRSRQESESMLMLQTSEVLNKNSLNNEKLQQNYLQVNQPKHSSDVMNDQKHQEQLKELWTRISMNNILKNPLQSSYDNLDEMVIDKKVRKSKTFVNKKSKTSVIIDGADYYKKYNEIEDNSRSLAFNFVGECYLGISKLLQSEYRNYDRRDSNILQGQLNKSLKQSHSNGSGNLRSNSILEKLNQAIHFNNEPHSKKCKHDIKEFEEQIWAMGKIIGTLSGSFILSNVPVIQQMALGILTETGIVMNAAPIIIEDKDLSMMGLTRKKLRNEQISQLIDLTKRLKKIDSFKTKRQIYQTYNDKERILNDMIILLSESDKTVQGHMYKYVDDFDLIRAQQAMIELAFHCLLMAESVRYEFKRDYYEILSQIFMRDELKLTNLSLVGTNARNPNFRFFETDGDKSSKMESRDQSFIKVLSPTNKDKSPIILNTGRRNESQTRNNSKLDKADDDSKEKIKQEKIKVASFYQKLLYQILDDCLNKFCRRDVEPYLKSYLEICISIAFFRVPKFQEIFLKCISEHIDYNVPEWKNVNWNIDEESISFQLGILSLFDWEINFHNLIPDTLDQQENLKLLKRIEGNKKWQKRVKKRSIAYFQIIRRWTDIINQTVLTHSLFWQDIPGYKIIVKSIILEMKARNVSDYPDSLIEAIQSLLQNTQLLTVFTNIIFAKTNVYDSLTLCNTMTMALQWINHIERIGLSFPSNFDFNYFFQGIYIALDIDHSISTPRTLYLIYRTMHFFPLDQRIIIVQQLLKRYFYQLIFSWSFNIRDIFMSLFLYQIEYQFINKNTQQHLNIKAINSTFTPNASTIELIQTSQEDEQQMKRLKQKRRQNLEQMEVQLSQYESIVEQNPNEAEEQFDQSLSMTSKIRIVTEIGGINVGTNIKTQQVEQQPAITRQLSDDRKTNPDRRKQYDSGQVLQSMFRQKLKELQILEEHYTQCKSPIKQSMKDISTMTTSSQGTSELKHLEYDSNTYEKIVQNIPQQLRVYIPAYYSILINDIIRALNDFSRQLEDFERWKTTQATFNNDIILVLPEFNMEKNMPVEDDENLAKKDEW